MAESLRKREQQAFDQFVRDMEHAGRTTTKVVGLTSEKDKRAFEELREKAIARYVAALRAIGVEPPASLVTSQRSTPKKGSSVDA